MNNYSRTSYKLSDIYPLTMDARELAQMTEYRLHRLPWEVAEVTVRDASYVSADRLYQADVFLRDGKMWIEANRYYADRRSSRHWEGRIDDLFALPKGALSARLSTLAGQADKARIGELIHLHHGIHTLYCTKGCTYVTVSNDVDANERWGG